jgi:type I restriction enzyme M protein
VTNSNKLTEKHIHRIVSAYSRRQTEPYFAKRVPNRDIAAQEYNLSVSTYVAQEDTREVVDTTKLNAEIDRIVGQEDVLRREIGAIVAEIEGVTS